MNDSTLSLAGIVLAAGGSARLGRPKQLVEWQGQSLVKRSAELALGVCDAGVAVVTGADAEAVSDAVGALNVRCLENKSWAEGMGGSLRQGLSSLPASADAVLLMVCDQPRIDEQDLAALCTAWRNRPEHPAAAAYANTLGVPAIVPIGLCGELAAGLAGDAGAGQWLRSSGDVSLVDMPNAVLDIDTNDDLRQLAD